MHESEIAALAEGMVPFVRECVAEAVKLPPELAAQVATAVRLLHESPPLEEQKQAPSAPPSRVTRIERDDDGNLVPVYDVNYAR
jgi:hypothetical protein